MAQVYTVYMHISPSKKYYIGQSCNLKRRWKNKGINYTNQIVFNRALKKYGWDNFEHKIIATRLTKSEANWLENYLICYYRTYAGFSDCKGYNCTLGGDGPLGTITWNKGKTLSDLHKLHLSESHKGKPSPKKGIKLTEDQKNKIRNIHLGKSHSKEWNNNIGKGHYKPVSLLDPKTNKTYNFCSIGDLAVFMGLSRSWVMKSIKIKEYIIL